MATLNLRCRGPSGQATLSGLDPGMAVSEFLSLLEQQTGVPAHAAELLTGFPPQLLQLPADTSSATLRDLGLANGDTFTLRRSAAAAAAAAPAPTLSPPVSAPSAAAEGGAPVIPSLGGADAPSHPDEDLDLARALAASLADVRPQGGQGSAAQTPAQPSGGSAAQGGPTPAPVSIPLPDGSCVTRRIIDSDNSCLFNAVGYVMEGSRARSADLRSVIATTVASDPVTYNDGFLGMESEEYCKWITNKDKWGGAIELSILCHHYKKEIAAHDILTKRCDIYGQGAGYTERVMLIYDGLHYDALAVAASQTAPEELDVTMYNPLSEDGREIEGAAAKLVEAANKARQFTDTANFTLRCGVCQIGLKGEKEAVLHAKQTGHSNFSEY